MTYRNTLQQAGPKGPSMPTRSNQFTPMRNIPQKSPHNRSRNPSVSSNASSTFMEQTGEQTTMGPMESTRNPGNRSNINTPSKHHSREETPEAHSGTLPSNTGQPAQQSAQNYNDSPYQGNNALSSQDNIQNAPMQGSSAHTDNDRIRYRTSESEQFDPNDIDPNSEQFRHWDRSSAKDSYKDLYNKRIRKVQF